MQFFKSVMPAARLRSLLRPLALSLIVVSVTACAMPGSMTMDHGNHANGHGDEPGVMEHDMMEHDEEMADTDVDHGHGAHGEMHEADTPFDAQFIDGMIEHHQGALDMAEEVIATSERAELLAFAQEIIDAQAHEIEMMNEWRAAWYPDLPPTGGMHVHMGDMEIADDPDKPFDQRFLEAMIGHHIGAIDMAVAALEEAEHEELRALAIEVIAVQQAEIDQMRAWLAEWFDVE
jgi:uncharacterized protein (DUF305 family)